MLALPPQATIPRIVAVAGVIVVVSGAFVARSMIASQQQAAPAGQTQPAGPRVQSAVVQAAPAARGQIRSVLRYAGGVQSSQQVNLVPRTNGIVKAIPKPAAMSGSTSTP